MKYGNYWVNRTLQGGIRKRQERGATDDRGGWPNCRSTSVQMGESRSGGTIDESAKTRSNWRADTMSALVMILTAAIACYTREFRRI